MPSTITSSVVIDAGLFLVMVLPHPYRASVKPLWRQWLAERRPLYAPYLWVAEVTSGLRKAVWEKLLTQKDAERALARMVQLPIHFIPDIDLAQGALTWAERLGQKRAYDAFYLALAERMSAEFWSADHRLVNSARQQGAIWAHWIGESADAER